MKGFTYATLVRRELGDSTQFQHDGPLGVLLGGQTDGQTQRLTINI